MTEHDPISDCDGAWSALLYDTLRDLAESWMRRERTDHTLQPTALVHEAFLRIAADEHLHIDDRTRFQALAATVMRRVLIDHARRRGRAKRGGGRHRVGLEGIAPDDRAADPLAVDDALARLACDHERAARVVELRFFGGMGVEPVAALLGVSPRTVELDWRFARAWLLSELGEAEA